MLTCVCSLWCRRTFPGNICGWGDGFSLRHTCGGPTFMVIGLEPQVQRSVKRKCLSAHSSAEVGPLPDVCQAR